MSDAGDFKAFRTRTVLPILRAMNERQHLKQQEQALFSAEEHAPEAESKKAAASRIRALDKFNQAVQLSATGVTLLRQLHKQVPCALPH